VAAKGGPKNPGTANEASSQLPTTSYQLPTTSFPSWPKAPCWPVGQAAKNELISNKAARHSWIPGDPDGELGSGVTWGLKRVWGSQKP